MRSLGGAVQGEALTATPLPAWISPLLERLRETGAFREEGREDENDDENENDDDSERKKNNNNKTFLPPNHVLVNSYSPGEGIMPHEDGPLYYPAAAIVSLGSWAVLRFYAKRGGGEEGQSEGGEGGGEEKGKQRDEKKKSVFSVALAPRSLVVFGGEAYRRMLHGIEAVEEERLDGGVLNNRDEEEEVAEEEEEEEENDDDDDDERREGRRRRRRRRDEQVARAAVPRGSENGVEVDVIPRGMRGFGATSEERVSLTVRRVLRVRKNLLRLGPRV